MPMLADTVSTCSSSLSGSGEAAREVRREALHGRAPPPRRHERMEHRDELVAAHARDQRPAAGRIGDAPRHFLQHRVTHAVAQSVVQHLEVIEVQLQHRAVRGLGTVAHEAQLLEDEHAVGQPREGIAIGTAPGLRLGLRRRSFSIASSWARAPPRDSARAGS